MERFLYRLFQTRYGNRFVLKGALVLRIWRSLNFRLTMDIDMFGRMSNEDADTVAQIRNTLKVEVEMDGLFFDPDFA